MNELITKSIEASIRLREEVLQSEIPQLISDYADTVINCLRNGGTVFFCGNGGSNADAQHLSTELSGRYFMDRPPLKSLTLGVNPAFNSAIGNDYAYESILSRELKSLGSENDVLIALSTSGNSPNILEVIKAAEELNITVLGFSGQHGGKMNDACKHLIKIPSGSVPRIQEMHMLLGHTLCEYVERKIFGS